MGNMLWETLKDEHPNPYKTSPLLYSLSPQFQFINSRLLSPLNWIWLVRAHYNSFWPGPCFTMLQQCAFFSVTSKQLYKCRAAKMLIRPNHLTIHRRHCVVNNAVSVAWLQNFNSKTVYFCLVCAQGHRWRHNFIKSLLWHYKEYISRISFFLCSVEIVCSQAGRDNLVHSIVETLMKKTPVVI